MDDKGHIAYIVNSLNPGGTEKLVVLMGQAFARTFRIQVICLDEPGAWAWNLRQSGIPVHCFWRQPGIDIGIAYKIAVFCREHNIAIIHAHQCTPWFYAALARTLYPKAKLLFEEHGRHYPETLNRTKNIVNRLCIQPLTNRIVAVSREVKERLVRYEGLSPTGIEVIYNGTYPPARISAEQRRALRASLGFQDGDTVLGTVGRLDPIKNLPLFLRGIEMVRKTLPQVKGLLVGDGPDRARLEALCRELGIERRVVFTGYRADATDFLQCMDIFVLCSFSEGTSMALLEAMACGIPAIVTNVGGNPELIRHGENGWVIPSDSLTDIIQAMKEAAVLDDDQMDLLAQRAVERFTENFTFEAMLEQYQVIYEQLLAGR